MPPTLHSRGRHHVRGKLWTRLAIALVAAMTLSIGPAALATPADTRQQPASASATKPTIVFVHGAFADASGWGQEVIALQGLGYDVIAPANPLRGLTHDSDHIRSVLATIPGPVVLVGHSYGGAVITNAARGADNVEALVYVGAFIPDAGQSILTSYDPTRYPGSLLGPDTVVVRPVSNPAAPGGHDADVYIAPASFRSVFAADQSRAVAEMMAATQRPLSNFAQTEASGEPAWRTIPSWALVTLNDRAISPGGQRFMAQRAGSHIYEVHSAHDVMVSHPDAVVKLILRAVRAAG
ncbi:alpha/beta fold hydrolase [Nocardioides sp. NPDC087217]|uniref:alpha/beta fold hydrolase n=1 Tax=Nocardioides sp. NPDC087217 TaxID=3364335 RepID=UPI0038259D62